MNQNVMTIYPAGTTNFDYQGYGTLYDAYSAEVTEASSTNGNITETMEITYPVNGVLSDKMVEGNLVKAQISKTDGDYQIFEIDETEKSDNTVITAYLNAYPYRVLRMSFTNGGKFANFETLTRLLDYAKSYMPDLPTDFKITTNISNPINLAQVQTDPSLTPVPTVFKDFSSLLDAILNKVSGQVKFGPRSIEILAHRGQDKSNIELRDDKNTNGISVKIDTTNIVNKIIPLLPVKDKDGNSTSETVVGRIVTPKDPFRFINFYSGQVVNVDTQDLANSYFSRTNCNYPVTTATVTTSMIDEDLSDIRLFDVVSVYSSRINYTAKLKVSERVFDVLAGAVDSFKLGTSSVNVFSTQTAAMNQVEQAVAIGNQALTSANGKNTNYYGDSKPTDGKEGDIWFHTVDGVSQMDQFMGGVWKTIVSDTFGKEVDKKVSTAQAEASDAKTKAEEGVAKAESTAAKFDDTNQKVKQALDNSVSAQADASSAVAKAESTASEFGTVKQNADTALSTASSAVAKAESTASEFGKVKQKADSAAANALSAQASASAAVAKASSAASDSKDAKQIAGEVSQSYKTLTDGSTMTIAELQNGLAAKLTKTDLDGYATQTWTQNQIKTTADGINGTMSSIKGTVDSHTTSINDLKADSSSFKSQFTTVNNTLGKQTTDIGTLQATSKELSSNFSSLNTANGTNEHNISDLQQSAKELSSTLLTVKNSGGGTNLIANSANDIIVDDTINKQGWRRKTVYDGLIAGQQYTFTSDVTVNTGNVAQIKVRTMNDGQTLDGPNKSVDIVNGHISWTFTAAQDKPILLVYAGIDSKTAGNKVTFHHYQLETGIVAHDWSPAPEDLATAVSKISQTVEGIQTDISKKIEQKDLNGYATETWTQGQIKLTADGISGTLSRKIEQKDLNGYATQTWTQNQIKTTADGINGTMSSIKGTVDSHTTSINDLKADSSSFKSQFTTVNNTLGKQTTDIGSLQATSKELTSGFNTLTTDNATNKNDISQLKLNATELSSTMMTVTQRINLDDRPNLLTGSLQDLNNWDKNKQAQNAVTNNVFANGTNTMSYQGVSGVEIISATLPTVAGNSYIVSIDFTSTSFDTITGYGWGPSIDFGTDQDHFVTLESGANNKRYLFRFVASGNDTLYLRFGNVSDGESNTLVFANLSLQLDAASQATATQFSNISQTVDGMKSDISKKIEQKDLNGYATQTWAQNQINTTANGINGTISSVKNTVDSHTTSINDLKADSSGFKARFQTVNNTIGKHASDIGTLQASAKSLSASFDSLNSDNKTNQHNISQLQLTSNSLSSTLLTVQKRVSDSSVGTNLLLKTYEPYVVTGANKVNQSGPMYALSRRLEAGTTVTLSFDAISTAPASFTIQNEGGTWMSYYDHETVDTTKKHYVVTITLNGSSQQGVHFRLDNVPSTVTITFSNMKLELGSYATDYSTNPADNATVTAVSSISQTIESIQTTVRGKADSSQITQLSDQITSTVNTLNSVGQKNLVYNATFDNNMEGWIQNKHVWYTTNEDWARKNGYQGAGLNDVTEGYWYSLNSKLIPCNVGKAYSASVVMNADPNGTTTNSIGVSLTFYDKNKQRFNNSWKDGFSSVKNEQTLIKVENFKAPEGSVYVGIMLQVYGGGHVVFTNPMLVMESTVGPFIPDNAGGSSITQLSNMIDLRVEKDHVVNAVNISPEGIQIYGNKLHITAATYIDNAIIKDAMISNVSADKMTTGTLNAANVNVININGSHIVSNSITSNQLASGSVTANKIQSGAIRVSLNNSLRRLEIGVDGMNLMSDAGAVIGRIHSNHMNYDSTFWGLSFDMSANGGDFMAWGAQNNGDVNGLYQTKLAWYRWSTHGYDGGFHFQDRVEFHNPVEFRNSIDTRANYLLGFGSTNVSGYSSVPYLGLSGGATKISFSPGSVWLSRHNNYYNMGAVIEGFSHYLGRAIFIPTGMHNDGRASSWLGINIPSS